MCFWGGCSTTNWNKKIFSLDSSSCSLGLPPIGFWVCKGSRWLGEHCLEDRENIASRTGSSCVLSQVCKLFDIYSRQRILFDASKSGNFAHTLQDLDLWGFECSRASLKLQVWERFCFPPNDWGRGIGVLQLIFEAWSLWISLSSSQLSIKTHLGFNFEFLCLRWGRCSLSFTRNWYNP